MKNDQENTIIHFYDEKTVYMRMRLKMQRQSYKRLSIKYTTRMSTRSFIRIEEDISTKKVLIVVGIVVTAIALFYFVLLITR